MVEKLIHKATGEIVPDDPHAVGTRHYWRYNIYSKKYPCTVVVGNRGKTNTNILAIQFDLDVEMGREIYYEPKNRLTPIK